MNKKKIHLIIALLFLIALGFFWRLKWWPNYVTFGYEQARDALAIQNIFFQKKLTLIGATTEIEGIFHGPIYYYLFGLPYFLFGKNPASTSLLHILINITTIPIIFFLGRSLFNTKTGLIAAFFFAISYEVASYSLWLSNPSPGLPLIILAYFFFYKSFKENQKYLPFACASLALAVQFDLIVIMHIIPVSVLYFFYNQKKLKPKTLLASGITFLALLSNYPLFEIRHDFLMTRKFFEVLTSQDAQFRNVFEYFMVYLNGFANEFANVLFPIHGFFAGLLMFILFFYLWRKIRLSKISKGPWLFILIWLFSPFPIFLISAAITNAEYSFLGLDAPICLLTAVFLSELLKKKKAIFAILIIFAIFLGNLRAWNNYFPNPSRKLFDVQKGVILKDNLAAVNYTYNQSSGKSFYVETLTVPLFISPLWDYLYDWHGQREFGYLPSQNNQTPIQFLIIEPGSGETYEIFRQRAINHINQTTELEETKEFGLITVEKRRLLSSQPNIDR